MRFVYNIYSILCLQTGVFGGCRLYQLLNHRRCIIVFVIIFLQNWKRVFGESKTNFYSRSCSNHIPRRHLESTFVTCRQTYNKLILRFLFPFNFQWFSKTTAKLFDRKLTGNEDGNKVPLQVWQWQILERSIFSRMASHCASLWYQLVALSKYHIWKYL